MDFTLREDLQSTFNGKQRLIITSNNPFESLNCQQYSLEVKIDRIEGIYKLGSFDRFNDYCRQIIYYENITKFFEEYYTDRTLNKTELK
jgi:hypothetical protein